MGHMILLQPMRSLNYTFFEFLDRQWQISIQQDLDNCMFDCAGTYCAPRSKPHGVIVDISTGRCNDMLEKSRIVCKGSKTFEDRRKYADSGGPWSSQ